MKKRLTDFIFYEILNKNDMVTLLMSIYNQSIILESR